MVHANFPYISDKLLFSVPNGGRRDKSTGAVIKRTSAKRGADVILLMPSYKYHCLCLEFKTDIGRQSEEQKGFQAQIERSVGKYEIVRSANDAIEVIDQYFNKK